MTSLASSAEPRSWGETGTSNLAHWFESVAVRVFILGLLAIAFLLSGCGDGGSASATLPTMVASTPPPTTVTTTPPPTTVSPPNLGVPPGLNQAVPPPPPSFTPKAPSAMRFAGSVALLKNFARTNAIGRFGLLAASSSRTSNQPAASSTPNPVVRFTTSLGNIDVELRPDVAPKNVANFLSYVNSGAYGSTSFIHRSVPGFILQGGGYYYNNGQAVAIPNQAPVSNEFNLSNVRGTLAMAKINGDPNSATSQWFFNLVDNSTNLDTQNGGSTVIGTIVDTQGLAVMDAIAALQVINVNSPFDALPVIDYSSGSVAAKNFVYSQISTLPSHPGFFNGEQNVGNGVYSLTFPNGNNFGFYSYLSDPSYIYHTDLGYEYIFDANDGVNGVYLYDFASGSWFYTRAISARRESLRDSQAG